MYILRISDVREVLLLAVRFEVMLFKTHLKPLKQTKTGFAQRFCFLLDTFLGMRQGARANFEGIVSASHNLNETKRGGSKTKAKKNVL